MSETKIVKVDPHHIKDGYIHEAAHILDSGGLVILPTETVYGIAANMLNQKAVDRLYEIKRRPKDKPFTIHLAKKDRIDDFARAVPVSAYKLIDRFWPGPLTLILKSINGGTVGLRMPDNEITLKVISSAHHPIVMPSANLSDNPPPSDFEQAIKDLRGMVDYAIDSGATKLGLESSIVDLSKANPEFLRIGALRKEDMEEAILKKHVLFVCTGNSCRSVMGEAVFKKIMKEKNRKDVEVSSAGIMMIPGLGVSSGTREVLAGEGIDVSGHVSHRVTKEMARKSDLILVMEQGHEDAILRIAPEVRNRVFLLKEFAKMDDGHPEISDPIGRSLDFYEKTLALIKEAAERVSSLI